MCADYSVDAISAKMQKTFENQMEQAAEEKGRSARDRDAQKSINKSLDAGAKRAAMERDRFVKTSEQRIARILYMKVERRFQAFPWLAEKVPPLSAKPSLVELQETDDLQRLELDLQGAEKRLVGYISKGSMLVENLWGDGRKMTFLPAELRLNLKGIHQVMTSEMFMKEAEPLITETCIEYPAFGTMPLPARWLECVANTLLMVHVFNTNPQMQKLAGQGAMTEEELERKIAAESKQT